MSQEGFLVGTNLLKIDKLTLAFNSVCKSKKDVVKSISLTQRRKVRPICVNIFNYEVTELLLQLGCSVRP